jgi:Type III restriction enzyme, res subunit/Helicase conserved C-terminal domain
MVNTTFPELKETKVLDLPPASLETLQRMREDSCSSSSYAFKLQPQQRFLRRVLSPDSPTQNLLLVHGVGVGKTCSAIQIAEEYILRPEFQDKKVLVLANPSIQENFKTQIFDLSRVSIDPDGFLTSKQCTGRRYLDILQRGQKSPIQLSSREQQETIRRKANKIISEFYEFQGYDQFANILERQKLDNTPKDTEAWIHATFDNRLIIIDEAHNLRENTEGEGSVKLRSEALKSVVKVANGTTLVLLTATPMYDTFEELFEYFNLFLWNARKQAPNTSITAKNFFDASGNFLNPQVENTFRRLCEEYISFVKGENPFTFPFRLPPPEAIRAKPDRKTDIAGKKITQQIKYLPLTVSTLSDFQASVVQNLKSSAMIDYRTICVLPENREIKDVFEKRDNQYFYKTDKFLAPSKVAEYSSKFSLITKILSESEGVAFVYSNIVELGVQLFAMCLEEHGYEPAIGSKLLGETANEVPAGSKGKYALITSQSSDTEITRLLTRLRRRENMNGQDIRVILASPKVSEGVDFRFVRQIHILDPWFNMSRIEQVIGRGMRVCSHALLPFEDQNTTVYLHVCRYKNKAQETLDENIYRTKVEQKGIAIAKVKRVLMESAMDCELEKPVNDLPNEWRNLKVPQRRNQDKQILELTISQMSSPAFIDDSDLECKITPSTPDPDHVRPLSSILDTKDEIIDKLMTMIQQKPIWTFEDVYKSKEMKQYEPQMVSYIIQSAIESRSPFRDSYGRTGHLEAKKGLLTFAIHENETLQDKTIQHDSGHAVPIGYEEEKEEKEEPKEEEYDEEWFDTKFDDYDWPEIANDFSYDVKRWYFVDNVLTPEEKRKLIFETNWNKPPIYAKPLKTEHLYIFGTKDDVYNLKHQKITPIGEELDEYTAWVEKLKQKFLGQKDLYLAATKEGKLVFNLDEKSVPIKKAERTKGIGGRACASYQTGVLKAFLEWLGGEFPAKAKNKPQQCMYLDLMVRKAVLEDEKEGLVWYTPEEWKVLSEEKKGLK